ncbi:Methyltransferase domain-containing protein [Anaerovirgula multivorans]|uniref:Methyltransferase domain-containing protein n=1 Tax=Anaerovirgula multivorans TaxID=312168 RepID=A0A239BEQ4_9FIRM|nr:class I SAM-dependent methyltransferase [Anaerovirgula multivorans]SNS05564.1 Methyltransferase domain-containing protein [Anaerovirgula multivorans]
MKEIVFNQTPLYRFLQLCNEEDNQNSRKILDCGAGGSKPPLSMFYNHGYETTGIDLDINQVEKADEFGHSNNQNLGIRLGDMTKLDFTDETFGFVYSYNSIFHMKKSEIEKSIIEMKRVLKPNGLMFVNFLSIDDFRCGEGPHLGENQYEQMDDDPVIHSYFEYNEAEKYFSDMKFVLKERRIIERIYEGERIRQGFIDYILRK